MSKAPATGRNLIIFLLCIFIAAAAYKYSMSSSGSDTENRVAVTEQSAQDKAGDEPVTAEMAAEAMPEEAAPEEEIKVNVAAALARRALGDPEAPVTVEDFSSLTCPHCARFHNDVFPKIKANYIDTGKVYWVATDFPLDRVAMQASVMARCAPVDAYFIIIDQLFATQKEWATSEDPTTALAKVGADAGLQPEMFEACLNKEALTEELFKRMQKAGKDYQISATPSFVLNEGVETITGELAYDKFAAKIDALLTN